MEEIEDVVVVDTNISTDYEEQLSKWLKLGYRVGSTACGMYGCEDTGFNEYWFAVLIKGVEKTNSTDALNNKEKG